MKIPIEWLKEYVDLKGIPEEEISEALTMSGTENEIVKGVDFPNIVVGEIMEITKHSNADKLQVTKTDVGKASGGILQIVCGAPNIEVGQKVPVALVGAQIGEFEIKEAEIRGVKSHGMLCSESELGISDDHAGIMILDARAQPGQSLVEVLNIGGTVLEAEITPNRGDCLSIIGVAREAAATLNKKFIGRVVKKSEANIKAQVEVEVKEKSKCPRYIAKVVEGVKIGPSPKWMQDRLSACGVRPINNVVDVTNYVMLEWGQPLHAFDFEKLQAAGTKQQEKKIIVRMAKEGEKLVTLDGVERKLTKSDLVIADAKGAIALAGVMGGENSEVGLQTTAIVLEAAVFDPVSVRKTAQRLALRSEASNRFEKGIPLNLPEIAIERAANLLAEISDEKKIKAGENTDLLSKWIWIRRVGIRVSEINKRLGVEIPSEKATEILKLLGFEAGEFDFKTEARKQIGKPYVLGASYKTHQDLAFDCSYLTDYIYSQIGKFIGHTSLAQYEIGKPVKDADLKPGDILFIRGKIEKSAVDHYYVSDANGDKTKVELESPKEVGHNAIYIGNGRIIHTSHFDYDYKTKKWSKESQENSKVVEEDLEKFLNHPEYLGARRYIEGDDWLAITVPWWRMDVKIPEDIVEEIGRIYGYENIPSDLPSGILPYFRESSELELDNKVREVLSGVGFSEVYNYSFVSEKSNNYFSEIKGLKISNPISPDQEIMRTSLAPSLLFDACVNQANFEEFSAFELAPVYIPEKAGLPKEIRTLGLVQKLVSRNPVESFSALKGALDSLFSKLGVSDVSYSELDLSFLASGAAATVKSGNETLGYVGLISEQTKEKYSIKYNVTLAEINLGALGRVANMDIAYKPISKYPTAKRDFTFEIKREVKSEKINKTLKEIKIENCNTLNVLDIYEDKLRPEVKSVTIRLVLGSFEKTLNEEEIQGSQNKVLELIKKMGGRIKTA